MQKNTKTVEELVIGELLLTRAKLVKNGKVELEFAQIIELKKEGPKSILGLLNASNDSFNVEKKPSRCWMTCMLADISKNFALDLSTLTEEGQILELNILEPKIVGSKEKLNIRLIETTTPTTWQQENIQTEAKRAGKDGDFIVTKNGEFIFRKFDVVEGDPDHIMLKDTMRVSSQTTKEKENLDEALGLS